MFLQKLHQIYQWLRHKFDALPCRLNSERPGLGQEGRDLCLPGPAHENLYIPSVGLMNFQPILDRVQRIIGYEICLNEAEAQSSQGPALANALRRDADCAMLAKIKQEGSLNDLLPFRKGFIQMGLSSLADETIHHGSSQHIIYVLEQGRQQPLQHHHIERIDVLIQAGFRFAVEPAYVHAPAQEAQLLHALFERMDYFVLDFSKPMPKEGHLTFQWISKHFGYVNWYARNVRHDEDVQSALSGFSERHFVLFHGEFVNFGPPISPVSPQALATLNPHHAKMMMILKALRQEAPSSHVSTLFCSDPILSFRLVRFANSPIVGLARPLHSIEACLGLLGREVVCRWLNLMLVGPYTHTERSQVLFERSLVRAKFLESLGRSKNCPASEAEFLYLTGLFSLLDLILGQPLRDVVHPNDLPSSTRDALIFGRGPFIHALDLVMAYEQGHVHEVRRLAQSMALAASQVSDFYSEALVWAQNSVVFNPEASEQPQALEVP